VCVVRLLFLFKHALYAHWIYSTASHSRIVRNHDELDRRGRSGHCQQTEDSQSRPPKYESKMSIARSERSVLSYSAAIF
jgi:hypothetical protein